MLAGTRNHILLIANAGGGVYYVESTIASKKKHSKIRIVRLIEVYVQSLFKNNVVV